MKINKGAAAEAPDIEVGPYKAKFEGMIIEEHPDWAGTDKFGHADDGRRVRFNFTLVDDEGEDVYEDGDPVQVSALTRFAFGPKSNAYAILKPMLTASEDAALEAGEDLDSDALEGRPVIVNVEKNKNGWPFVAAVIPPMKPKGSKAKPIAQAEAEDGA